MEKHFTEADISAPVKEYFMSLGYKVRSEVKGCDLAAEKDGELVIIELKKTFNLKLVYQVLGRLSITEQVYAAIPRPKKSNTPEYEGMIRLMKRLKLGLITVAMDSPVKTLEVLLMPGGFSKRNTARRAGLIKEMDSRLMDLNKGGTVRTKIITAYRERCIKIACILKCRGVKRPRDLVSDYGCEKDAAAILQRNFDGWFVRVEKGVYDISPKGIEELCSRPNALTEYYLSLYATK